MRIAVDAMGGDQGPSVVVPGAVKAAREHRAMITLVGDETEIRRQLASQRVDGLDIKVVHAPDVITMDDHPAQAVRRKPESSINIALKLVQDGRAAAMMSAGNSGAVMAAALLHLGRLPGIERPALATPLATQRGQTLLLDLGAVTDPKPHNLVQFARMGSVYAELVLGVKDPSVGLLSNGEEPGKGNQLVQRVYPLLSADGHIRFHGNVEGRDIALGTVDVVVTDGFTGNVALKSLEGMATVVTHFLREEVTKTLPRKLAAAMLRGAFRGVRQRLDYREYGGAPLLGVAGPTIIAHGRSDELAIMNAIRVARLAADLDLVAAIKHSVADSVADPDDR